jgi:hypothetical protein
MSDNKIFGQTVPLPDTKCPYCFALCNAALPLAENGKRQAPKVHSLLVCQNCTRVSRFANNLMLVRISDDQLKLIIGLNPAIARQLVDLQLAAARIVNQTGFRKLSKVL